MNLFVDLKVFYEGDVDPLSGMVLNLKEIDQKFFESQKKTTVFAGPGEVLRFYFDRMKPRKLELKRAGVILGFDGKTETYSYNLSSWFDGTQRRVRLHTSHPLKKSWRQNFRKKLWSHPNTCVLTLKKLVTGLVMVEIERLEIGGAQRWQI